MTVDVPKGDHDDAPPEQSKQGNPSDEKEKFQKPNSKKYAFVAVGGLVLVIVAILIGVLPDWKDKRDDVSNDSNTQSNSNSKVSNALYLVSRNATFDAKIPLFSPTMTEGYSSDVDLEKDLEQLAKFLLNDAINSNKNNGGRNSGKDRPVDDGDMEMGAPGAPESDAFTENTDAQGSGGDDGLEDVNAFETNNQEFSVDRADFVKSDGNLIFAAYSDYLVVWTIDGQGIIAQIQMSPLDVVSNPPVDVIDEEPPRDDGATGGSAGGEHEPLPAAEGRSDIMYWNPKPRIEALLIHENRLTVIVSGYSTEHSNQLGYTPALYDYLGTRIQVYDINNGNLNLISETEVNGSYRNAYSMEENVYVVTQSGINTWEHLLAPVQRWQPQFEGLDDEAYVQSVVQLVDDGLVQDFVEKLLAELKVNGDIDLARLSAFTDSISENHLDDSLYSGGVANAVTQVVSFDMTVGNSNNNGQPLVPDIAATFQPGSWGHVYAMSSMIIVADQGWSWIASDERAAQKTYLIGFRLDGPSSTHAMVGSVDGYLLNPFSLDFVEKVEGNYVRIATTQDFWTPWFVGAPVEDGEVIMMTDPDNGADAVTAMEEERESESSTLNQIIVLKVPSSTQTDGETVLAQVGSVELGEPNESFTTVRFFDNFAYAVTYERIDPFYVVDLSNEQPIVLGELKINGFSEYLHPIDSNDQYLVAIGQNASDTGEILGYMVSLFDTSDATNPSLVDRLTVEQDKNSWSSSTASWDERAFRFVSLGDKKGKLIIPLSIYTWQEFDESTGERLQKPIEDNFEGFTVFNIEDGQITKDFDIDHSYTIEYNEKCDYWYDWLPERSFVFNGNVMTMKKHTIVSTSLSTGNTMWTMPINETFLGCD